jgi:hypothetical protein
MSTPDLHHTAAKVATMLAFHCVRNSYLEDLHAGIFPSSQTGDYTDVKVRQPLWRDRLEPAGTPQ